MHIHIHFDNWLICNGLVTAQASLHTISLWFIWSLKLASLQPAIGALGWDNWFCISHRIGWNNIQDGQDDRDLANLPHIAPHFDLHRLPSVGPSANLSGRFWLLSRTHPLKKCWQWASERKHPPKSWTCSSGLRGAPHPAVFALAEAGTS